MCTHWDALILNDYEVVMPLPWRKKWGIYYLYQPFITAQLGLFGNNITAALLLSFLKNIPNKFRYWDLVLNSGNVFKLEAFPLYTRSNYVLDLNKNYPELFAQYSQTTKRNIKKSYNHIGHISKEVAVEKVIVINKSQSVQTNTKATEDDYKHFEDLFHYLKEKGKAKVYGSFSKEDELLAAAVFFFHKNRAYYILVGNSAESKATGASHRLIDAFIQDHAGQQLVLDFEGSDVESLAFFYASFGAVEEKYSALRVNKLPALLKWLKQ
jgi:lipid II:glycine glycyltransferase (peptidoglycan interpeptide bridge formation enzyme)